MNEFATVLRRTARAGLVWLWVLAAAAPAVPSASAQAEAAQGDARESVAHIRSAAERYARSLLPANARTASVEVGQLDGRLRLAPCAAELTASLPAGMSLQTRSTVGVTCNTPTRWTVYVPVSIEMQLDVLVLTRAVSRDARLTAADVRTETRSTGAGAMFLTRPDELAGLTLRRPLAAGTALQADMFTADLIVHRGQQVTLLSSGGAIEVRASGRAMADAAAGGRVAVQNLSSMRIVEGVVESADVVRIAR
jgi:flagellar basal body P-ring formation protein FlgA